MDHFTSVSLCVFSLYFLLRKGKECDIIWVKKERRKMRRIELILKDEKTEETLFVTQLFGLDFNNEFFYKELKDTFGIETYCHCFPETKVDFQSLFIIIEKTIANMITQNKTKLIDRDGCFNIYMNPITNLTSYIVNPMDSFTRYEKPKENIPADVGPLRTPSMIAKEIFTSSMLFTSLRLKYMLSLEGLIENCNHCLFGMSDNVPMLRNGVVAYIVSL